jgi:Leucine-rich repeat (LRR) protein
MSDLKAIEKLKSICSFSCVINNDYCESISFFDQKNILESTIRRSPDKRKIVKIVSEFPFLKSVNFRKSKIEEFPNFQSKEIEYLDLSCNEIVEIDEINMPKLKVLNLGANRIKKVPDLDHLSLNILKLHKNPIKKLPKIKTEIQVLNLFLTGLQEVPEIVSELKNLEVFSFGSNIKINRFPYFCSNLKWLTMPLNGLDSFPKSLYKCEKLEGLILSKNKITKLPDDIAKLKSLKILSLYKNLIKKIPESFFNLNLEKLSIAKNQIKDYDLKRIKEVFGNIEFIGV